MDIARIMELRDKGYPYREIGELIAWEEGRSIRYQATTIGNVVSLYKKELPNKPNKS